MGCGCRRVCLPSTQSLGHVTFCWANPCQPLRLPSPTVSSLKPNSSNALLFPKETISGSLHLAMTLGLSGGSVVSHTLPCETGPYILPYFSSRGPDPIPSNLRQLTTARDSNPTMPSSALCEHQAYTQNSKKPDRDKCPTAHITVEKYLKRRP